MSHKRELTNPKPRRESDEGRAHWYPYYAGYSPAFVADILDRLQLGPDASVLDPWNGSGTTTTVCSLKGVHSRGFDINPAMIVVARARLLPENTASSLAPLLKAIVQHAKASSGPAVLEEPLLAWFGPETSIKLRAVERSIRHLLTEDARSVLQSLRTVENLSSLSAFFYVLLFRLVRRALKSTATTNPTWVRARAKNVRAMLTWTDIAQGLAAELQGIRLLDECNQERVAFAQVYVSIGDSLKINVADSSVDAVITSPPYCTRIDYAVATRVELAVLNMDSPAKFEELRRGMLGTTLANKAVGQSLKSESANILLDRIRSHPSKASSTYYYSTYSDYFFKLESSLAEIARALKPRGTAALVVQDSSYKELHVDLATAVTETFSKLDVTASERWNFPVLRSMRQIHTGARSHSANWRPTESVLLFEKN
ncbi:site-specific DNA-methyltransferase [Xanthomonas sacchari]|uniref:site-specific DNA-methyltransferase n=1 Tax=Xanthomonas sacchari TaxID=56458 RepID=UPI002254A844|nr:site-specific DNA-methyltransferase [Xanthomonas sacchari]MCW0413207.1 hypothetical protein [Xanthomonas sacchari]UYK64769.1 site-specific DNA-methyltransferase [Xanthomonas sacchari]